MYDFMIVGAGLYGEMCTREIADAGKSILVIDKRPHIDGDVYTEIIEKINVHKCGTHIFHTYNKSILDYVNHFTNSPAANYKGALYSFPFNMCTFNKIWGVVTPDEAAAKIEEQRKEVKGEPKNLEEHAISLVGRDEDGKVLPKTVISREYSSEWKPGDVPYYPLNDEKNSKLYAEYKKLPYSEERAFFYGRLGVKNESIFAVSFVVYECLDTTAGEVVAA